jgi:hypothetical protein
MKFFLGFLAWCVVFALCWPVAVLAIIFFPIAWLVLLPFRLAFIAVEAMVALVKVILFLPARLFGSKRGT